MHQFSFGLLASGRPERETSHSCLSPKPPDPHRETRKDAQGAKDYFSGHGPIEQQVLSCRFLSDEPQW